jgi:hypothetical protein
MFKKMGKILEFLSRFDGVNEKNLTIKNNFVTLKFSP